MVARASVGQFAPKIPCRGARAVCPSRICPITWMRSGCEAWLSHMEWSSIECSVTVADRGGMRQRPAGLERALHAGSDVEQSFGADDSLRTMMSTHCSLLMGAGLFRANPMTSAFVSASVFGAGLILGYALRAWRVQRRDANSSYGTSRRTPQPTSTFGHARRAF